MSPLDEARGCSPATADGLDCLGAVLAPAGRTLLLYEGAGPPPDGGWFSGGDARLPWRAVSWRSSRGPGFAGLGLVEGRPALRPSRFEVAGTDGREIVAIGPIGVVEADPAPVAAFVATTGGDPGAVLGFVVDALSDEGPDASACAAFARRLLALASEPDGFLEILAAPEGGGLYAQGWARSIAPGPLRLAMAAERVELRDAEVALFSRSDVLAPARGFALFGLGFHATNRQRVEAAFFEAEGRLRRLDVADGAAPLLRGPDAMAHIRGELPRLDGAETTLRAFRRVCRPRFEGQDTLSAADLPVAAALDRLVRVGDGGMLAIGWLLDPLRRVERVILRGEGGLHAPLDRNWVRTARPDLVSGFAADPRFRGLLDPADALHGFVAFAPADHAAAGEGRLWLEIVLADETCLFLPLPAARLLDRRAAARLLAELPQEGPEAGRLVADHLAPFLSGLGRVARPASETALGLGRPRPGALAAAVMPVGRFTDLQPVFALLTDTPDAADLDLVLVATRALAGEVVDRIAAAFDFYALSGRLIVAPEAATASERLDLGAACGGQRLVFAWSPAALPRAPGWLGRLAADHAALGGLGLVAPLLRYEDGSIRSSPVGETRPEPLSEAWSLDGLAGRLRARLAESAEAQIPAGPVTAALVDRESLERAGGFAGRILTDAFAHLDLAARLAEAGALARRSAAVEFWTLDDPAPAASQNELFLRRLDAAILERRTRRGSGAVE